jgi:poly-gamma-glutamate synthesis protein (capsule biosynthesis protein)
MPRVLIGGDVVPLGRALPAFEEGDAAAVFHDLLPAFEAADLAVVNLECPLIEREEPIRKTGPHLGAPTRCAGLLGSAGIGAATLANNHILDHGPQGLQSTVRACAEAGVETFGAGANLDEAARLRVLDAAGLRVGCLGMAEREWCAAGADTAGACPAGAVEFVRAVRQAAGTYDFLLVLLHAGLDYYPYPTPRLRDLCRFMIEEGAGAVVCQHSHRPGSCEWYRGGLIVYGQGNLVFDPFRPMPPFYHRGFLVDLEVAGPGTCEARFLPYVQSLDGPGARRMAAEGEAEFLEDLEGRNRAIADEAFVREEFRRTCRQRLASYLSTLHGSGAVLRWLHNRLGWLDWVYGPEKLAWVLNVLRREGHREAIEEACLDRLEPPEGG